MAQEARLNAIVTESGAELVVLARYIQILSDDLAAFLTGRCINIHHSFVPGFKGAKPHRQAHARGVKLIGATAHYVTGYLDEGAIIEQDIKRISHNDSPEDLVRKGRDIERRMPARAIALHLEVGHRQTARKRCPGTDGLTPAFPARRSLAASRSPPSPPMSCKVGMSSLIAAPERPANNRRISHSCHCGTSTAIITGVSGLRPAAISAGLIAPAVTARY